MTQQDSDTIHTEPVRPEFAYVAKDALPTPAKEDRLDDADIEKRQTSLDDKYAIAKNLDEKTNKNLMGLIKNGQARDLTIICVAVIVVVYIFDSLIIVLAGDKLALTDTIIDTFKTTMLIVVGYMFGQTNSENN